MERVLRNRITFDDSAKGFILECFGKGVDSQGYIVDRRDWETKVKDAFGNEIHISEFGGIAKGSEEGTKVFFKSDLSSMLYLIDNNKE